MQNSDDSETSGTQLRLTKLGAASKPLTVRQKYQPEAPPKAARRWQVLRHALLLPRTLWRI